MSQDEDPEIYSEYYRIKNRLMDYDENLREAVVNIRMLQKMRISPSRAAIHYAKAQKHVALVMDLGLSCGAIPGKTNDIPNYDKRALHIKNVITGNWRSVEDFEECQEFFRECYQHTKFYNIIISKDTRPAVVKKYGKSPKFNQ